MEKSLLDAGYRKYAGSDVDVFFNTNICIHSGNCVNGNKNVFDLKRKPWILADADHYTAVQQTIDTCPSGALRYIIKEDAK